MMRAVENENYPEESRNIIASALSQIEAYLTECALVDILNVPMTKFTLSSTLGVVEKREINTTEDKVIRYILSTADPIDDKEAEEIERLESTLEEQTKNELLVAGRLNKDTLNKLREAEDEVKLTENSTTTTTTAMITTTTETETLDIDSI